MVVRNDISVLYSLSPRVVRVAAPSTEVTIQDLHDTLRALEDEPGNMQYPALIDTTGKQPLGGVASVGLTAELKNARLSFDARRASLVSGSVTGVDATGVRLIDATATFIADGVEPGMWVINLTDGSVCTVMVVASETQIVTDGLGDGSSNGWAPGDQYKIWPVIQAEVLGGNLVAVNEASVSIDAILPTAGTQVVRTSASSATLVDNQRQVARTALTIAGSTDSLIRTDISVAAGFYDGLQVQIIDGEQVAVRRIDHQAANGTIYPTTSLPFTPAAGATVLILSIHSSTPSGVA